MLAIVGGEKDKADSLVGNATKEIARRAAGSGPLLFVLVVAPSERETVEVDWAYIYNIEK
jgi:hypothetical protein